MRTPKVALEDDDKVIINPSDDVKPEDWRTVVLFWSRDIVAPIVSRQLSVPMTVFVEKLSWLRDVWKVGGGAYDISSEVMFQAKKFVDGAQAFRILKTQNTKRYTGMTVEVPNLLATRKLTPRQHENILYLLDMANGSNFSVPGAGKTLTVCLANSEKA